MRGHLGPETVCGPNIGVWSMRLLLDSETKRKGRGSEGHRTTTGLPCTKIQSWPWQKAPDSTPISLRCMDFLRFCQLTSCHYWYARLRTNYTVIEVGDAPEAGDPALALASS